MTLALMARLARAVVTRLASTRAGARLVGCVWSAAMLSSRPATMPGMVKRRTRPGPRLATTSAVYCVAADSG